jgi:hypothetical protein
VLKRGGVAALGLAGAGALEQLVTAPLRPATASGAAKATKFSDIQFDIGNFIKAIQTVNDGAGDVLVQFAPVFSLFLPVKLTRTPNRLDQATMARMLNTIEANFAPSPTGVLITSVSYSVRYFNRLPKTLVNSKIPRLASDHTRFVLEEAVPFDTDVIGGQVGGPNALMPGRKKDRFNVDVTIEKNDILLHFRSDSMTNLSNIVAWLSGSNTLNGKRVPSPHLNGLYSFQTPRVQFLQPGMPRQVAEKAGCEFATRINPKAPMVMGFVDQQVNASGPPAVVTFVGNASAKLSTANPGDYFDNGSIAHFSHVIDDLYQFYSTPDQDSNRPDGETFQERVQYMFRNNQLGTPNGVPAEGNDDQYTDGGGPAFVNNVFQGTTAAIQGAQDSAGKFGPGNESLGATFTGLGRVGHESALQQVSRAADGTPLHIRMDGPGFDGMDVPAFRTFPGDNGVDMPAGSEQFKLQFMMFVPTADLFAQMRNSQAAQQYQHQFLDGDDDDNGLERFITATRRQNFLVPPRRHRAMPLVELT